MKKSFELGIVIQIITGITVVIGLGLVVWELQQTQALTRAQLAGDSWNLAYTRYSSLVGEDAMSVVAKACDASVPLSTEEKIVLYQVFFMHVGSLMRTREVETLGGFTTQRWKRMFDNLVGAVYAIPHGRNWVEARKSVLFDSEMMVYYEQKFDRTISSDCLYLTSFVDE